MVSYQSCRWLLFEGVVQMSARPHLYGWNPPQLNQPHLESFGFGFATKNVACPCNRQPMTSYDNFMLVKMRWVKPVDEWICRNVQTHQTWGLVQTKGSIWMRRIPSTCQLFWCSTGYETHIFCINQHQWTVFGNAPHPQATFQRPWLKVLWSPHIIAE